MSFHWACTWIGIHGCRALCHNDSGGKIPGLARLRRRLEALHDPLSVNEVAHALLEHARGVWADQAQPRRLTETETAEIAAWIEAGDLQRDIAAAYGCSLSTVKRICRLMHPKAPRAPLTEEIREEIQRLRLLGLAVGTIARKLNLPYSRVRATITAMPAGWSCPDVTAAAVISAEPDARQVM